MGNKITEGYVPSITWENSQEGKGIYAKEYISGFLKIELSRRLTKRVGLFRIEKDAFDPERPWKLTGVGHFIRNLNDYKNINRYKTVEEAQAFATEYLTEFISDFIQTEI